MPPKKPSPRRVAAAVHAVNVGGRSLRDVAEEYGTSYVTVLRWVNKAKLGAKPKAKADPPWKGLTSSLAERSAPPEDAEDEEPAEEATLLEQVRALQRDMLSTAKAAKGVGNMKAAQAALASAGLLANTIARIAKTEAEGADVIRVPRSTFLDAQDTVRARLAVSLSRGEMRCPDCSRALSAEWGEIARNKKKPDGEGGAPTKSE